MIRYGVLIVVLMSVINMNSQTIDQLLEKAVDNNPELKALKFRYERELQLASQVSQLPDPQLGIGVPVFRPETRLGPQILSVSITQMFPWFGTLGTKQDVVVTMAKSKYEDIMATRLELFYNLKTAYYQLYFLDEKQMIIRKNIKIYDAFENVSLSKVESGKSNLADVLRIQIKLQSLKKEIDLIENQKKVYHAQINKIINEPLTNTIDISEDLNSIALIDNDSDKFKEKIQNHHPLMNKLNWEIESSKKEQKASNLEGFPSLGLGLDYSMVGNRTDANPQYNGRDILIPKIMISIPIFREKYSSRDKQEILKQQEILNTKINLENDIMSLLQSYKSEYDNTLITIDLINQQISHTNNAYNILLSEYSSKGTKFDELIQLQNELIQYDLALLNARVQTYLIKAKIDKLTDF